MTFESKVSAWNKVSFSVRLIALEGIGTSRNERWIVLAPYGQQWGLIGAKVFSFCMCKLLFIQFYRQPVRVLEEEESFACIFIRSQWFMWNP